MERPVADAVAAVHKKVAEVDTEEWMDTAPIDEVAKVGIRRSMMIQFVDH